MLKFQILLSYVKVIIIKDMTKEFTKIFWQAVLVGILTGLSVVLFRLGIENIFDFVMSSIYSHTLLFILTTTLGGLLSGILVYKFAPETSGSGIPYVKTVLLRSGKLIRVRTIFIKFFAGIIGIGTGLSLGREGPSVQLGAGVGSFVGKIFHLNGNNKNKLIASGAGAAIGATFNAPIAGALFVLEELVHKFTPTLLFPVLVATVTAATVAEYFFGNNPAFGISLAPIKIDLNIVIVCIVLGIAAGAIGVLFSKTIFFLDGVYSKIKIPNYFKPAIAGLITGLIGLAVPFVLSSGNNCISILTDNGFAIKAVCIIFILKFFVTPICFSSGAAGGIFLPMLMLGSFLGYITGFTFNNFGFDLNLASIASLGMAGFLASVARTPITAVVMVFEMTGGYGCILPLMLTAAVADLTAERFNHKPIYSILAVNQYKKLNSTVSKEALVKDVMSERVRVFKNDADIAEILATMREEGHRAYPVVDDKNRLAGIITGSDIEDALIDSDMKNAKVNRILDTSPVVVYPDESIFVAYYRLHENSTEWAVVTDKKRRVLGIVTRRDILGC